MKALAVHPVSLGPDRFGDAEIFSAFYPLGCLVAYAKAHRGGALREAFDFGRITPVQARQIPEIVSGLGPENGIFLLSSYVWNHAANMEFARRVKAARPGALVIVGGPHIPRQPDPCRRFFAENPDVDVAVRHEGELTLAEVLDTVLAQGLAPEDVSRVDLSAVTGLTFRRGTELVRTPDRARQRDLSAHPSPYTTGEYDHWLTDKRYMPLETNRGCPYGCTFCDWGAATLSKISQFSLERVFGEIDFAARHRVETIGFCDANFGIFERDLEIVRYIVDVSARTGFPKDVGYTNAKTAKPRLGTIIKTLRDAGLTNAAQISMQTTDAQVLENVERANIRTSEYRKMIAFFHAEDIPTVSDMMLGLPGQTFTTCQRDLQFFFDHKVLAVVFATSVMPNAPMADPAYQKRFQIELDDGDMVASTYSFDRAEYTRMFELCLAYKLFVKLGILKYVLYYAQIEHGVPAAEFLARWLGRVASAPELYPLSARVKTELLGRDYRGGRKDWLILVWGDEQAEFLFEALPEFHDEIRRFFRDEHGVSLDGPDAAAVFTANREILPKKGRALPAEVPLSHDVPAYFEALRRLPSVDEMPEGHVPLSGLGPGVLRLAAGSPCTSYGFADVGLTYGALELPSNLRL
jgi:tRNA A37 methylthiotransferase MiaB